MTKPFRWSLTKREQLGTLVDTVVKPIRLTDEFLSDLRAVCARVLALSGAANLAFIGRSPENLFDYLSGVFADIEPAPNRHLIQFSLRYAGEGGVAAMPADQLSGLFDYFTEEGVDAASIATGARPLALVDFVAYGGTMENLITLLKLQAERDQVDWNAVQRRLMIIGLTTRTKNSPNTWRWQQEQDWLGLIPDAVIKNVSAPSRFIFYIANIQPKVTRSHHPGQWAEPRETAATPSADQQRALLHALGLFERANTKDEKARLAALIAKTKQMKSPAVRRLVLQLKGKA